MQESWLSMKWNISGGNGGIIDKSEDEEIEERLY